MHAYAKAAPLTIITINSERYLGIGEIWMDLLSASSLVAIYTILVGFAMIGMWTMLLATNQMPELHEKPKEATFHLIAEISTAVLLVISGIGLLLGSEWARTLSPISLGMLLYSVIYAAGFYAHQDNLPMATMFIVLTILTIIAIVGLLKYT